MGNTKSEVEEKIRQLEEKFRLSGQDLGSYLDGLLHSKYLTYWDYIELDTLLSLQKTRTHFPDEKIFISYHQITELYFKLILHELEQVCEKDHLTVDFLVERLNRISRYFRILTDSFDVMIRGMDREQFLRFRMSLLPASGFQSAQYRMIEFYCTPVENLIHNSVRDRLRSDNTTESLYEHIYWKHGATDEVTGEKTLTLKQFEEKYSHNFVELANKLRHQTLYDKYLSLPETQQENEVLKNAMRQLDVTINVNWSLIHIGAAQRYLMKKKGVIAATGGTNWEEFLPPSFQRIIFFPQLWNEKEKQNWGKQWVDQMFNIKPESEIEKN